MLKNGCITIDEYKATIENGEVTTVEKGSCSSSENSNFGGQVITEIPSTGHTGVKAIVYLDPTDITIECNAELAAANVNENGSPTGIKSGCMKWYAFKEDDKTYTMLLDHNTTAAITWITQADYEQTGSQTVTPSEVGIEYDGTIVKLNEKGLPDGTWSSNGTNNRGPITLLNQLKDDTSNWVVAETLTDSDSYPVEWTANTNNNYSGNQKYTINYNGYKARLLRAEEINVITKMEASTLSEMQGVFFDNSCSNGCNKAMNIYGWLFDYTGVNVPVGTTGAPSCTQYGCNAGNNYDQSYWLLEPSDTFGFAYGVGFSGRLHSSQVGAISGGIRPVITVSKSKLGIN